MRTNCLSVRIGRVLDPLVIDCKTKVYNQYKGVKFEVSSCVLVVFIEFFICVLQSSSI